MSAELLYTSAPQGLRSGSRGFCTVVSTAGMPINLATRLEALSAYRHVYPPQDPSAHLNPVGYSHLKVNVGGRPLSILSRFAAYGVDYSQRTNKLVHHIVLEPDERGECGAAALLQSNGLFSEKWDGNCRTPATGPNIPTPIVTPAICRRWEAIQGDAGWAGVVADCFAASTAKPLWIVFSVEQSELLLPLIAESVALLPPSQRWNATFSTYFTNLPPDVDCKVRCVLAGTDEARLAPARGMVLTLGDRTKVPETPYAIVARTGSSVASDSSPPASPQASPATRGSESEPAPKQSIGLPTPSPKFGNHSADLGDALTAGPPAARTTRPLGLPLPSANSSIPHRSAPWLAIISGGAALLALLTVVAILVNPKAEPIGKTEKGDKSPVLETPARASQENPASQAEEKEADVPSEPPKGDLAEPVPVKLNARAEQLRYSVIEGGTVQLRFKVENSDPNTKLSVRADGMPFDSPVKISEGVLSSDIAAPTKAGTYKLICVISDPPAAEELIEVELVVENSQPKLAVDDVASEYDPNEPLLLTGSWTDVKLDPSTDVYLFAQTLDTQQRPGEVSATAELTKEGKWKLVVPTRELYGSESVRIGIDDREGAGAVFSSPIPVKPRRSVARLHMGALSVGKVVLSVTVNCECEREPRSYSVGNDKNTKTFPISKVSFGAKKDLRFEIQNGNWKANELSLDLAVLEGAGLPESLRALYDQKDEARAISERLAELREQTGEVISQVSLTVDGFNAKDKVAFNAIKALATDFLKWHLPSVGDIVKLPDNIRDAVKSCRRGLSGIKDEVDKWPSELETEKRSAIGRLTTVLSLCDVIEKKQISLAAAIEQVHDASVDIPVGLMLWAPDGTNAFSAKRRLVKEIPVFYLRVAKEKTSESANAKPATRDRVSP